MSTRPSSARPSAREFFTSLGDEIHARWRAAHFDFPKFEAIAEAALRDRSPSAHFEWDDILVDFLSNDALPTQRKPDFSDLQLTLYRQARFYIEALVWTDGSTTIHGHGFRGAFHVLSGGSVHSRYAFAERRRICDGLLLGDVVLRDVARLEPGDTCAIAGDDLIHGLFHLERPSMTIVVRTNTSYHGPQYSYLPPGVAYDPQPRDDVFEKQMDALRLLRTLEHPAHAGQLAALIERRDLHATLLALKGAWSYLAAHEELAPVLARARAVHGDAVDELAVALARDNDADVLYRLRDAVHEPSHRFFLALLLSLQEQRHILRMIEAQTGQPPLDDVMRWVRELSTVRHGGRELDVLDVNVSSDATAHGEQFGDALAEAFLWYFRATMERRNPADVRAGLRSFAPALTDDECEAVLKDWADLDRTAFAPLFR